MNTFQLKAEARVDLGKKAAKTLRSEGKIPVVLNGGELVELPFNGTLQAGEKLVEIGDNKAVITTDLAVTVDAVRKLVYTPDVFAIELEFNGQKKMAVLREIQFHPVTDAILHVDFYQINEENPIVMEVPVQLEGLAEGVKAGGKLALQMRKLKVKALYNVIPERLNIDVTSLALGKTIKVGELNFEGLELLNAKEAVVCAVKLTRAARGAQAAAGK